MRDYALQQLFEKFQQVASSLPSATETQDFHALWFADENCHEVLPHLAPYRQQVLLISNRFDIAQHAEKLELKCIFNDVDLPKLARLMHFFVRISKEKAVTHHLINQAIDHLNNAGSLHIAGYKNEGIKTYAKKCAALFSASSKLEKTKDSHSGTFGQPIIHGEKLETDQYEILREVANFAGSIIVSKPGTFGYDKLDEGSLLLLDTLREQAPTRWDSILDLGCGYGLLTLGTHYLNASYRAATDNNAAALIAMAANAKNWKLDVDAIPADAGDKIEKRFDLVICNPPFHQGFDVESDLTDKFLRAAKTKLNPGGSAYFVVNSFIGLEKKAAPIFKSVITLKNTGKFKVILLE